MFSARLKLVALRWVVPCHGFKSTRQAKQNSTWCHQEATKAVTCRFMLRGDQETGTSPVGDIPGDFEGAAQSLPRSGGTSVPCPPPCAPAVPCPPHAPQAAFCSSRGR